MLQAGRDPQCGCVGSALRDVRIHLETIPQTACGRRCGFFATLPMLDLTWAELPSVTTLEFR